MAILKKSMLTLLFFAVPTVSLANIFGPDPRIPILPTSQDHFKLVSVSVPGIEKCSGAFIGPNLVLTAAHCVLGAFSNPQVSTPDHLVPNAPHRSLDVLYGYYANHAEKVSSVKSAYLGLSSMTHYETEYPHDIAILVLTRTIGKSSGSLPFSQDPRDLQPMEQNLTISAYDLYEWAPDSRGHSTAVFNQSMNHGCSIRSQRPDLEGVFFHDCATERGASGAPLLVCEQDQPCRIIALHIGEQRNGGETSLKLPAYSDDYANYAISVSMAKAWLEKIISVHH